jgi:hypothetical protein
MNGFPEEDDMGLAKEHKLQQEIDQQNSKSAIRIAIAEACGWTREYADVPTWNASLNSYQGGYEPVQTLLFRKEEKCFVVENLPDYLSDLNAMHEAEKSLNPSLAGCYARTLTSIAWQSEQPVFAPMTATAAHRAEAYLRTIGKWTTNPNEL